MDTWTRGLLGFLASTAVSIAFVVGPLALAWAVTGALPPLWMSAALVVLGVLGLWPLNKLRIRRAALQMKKRSSGLLVEGHVYRRVDDAEREFPAADHAWMKQRTAEVERLGFHVVADIENVSLRGGGLSFFRVLLDDARGTLVTIAHMNNPRFAKWLLHKRGTGPSPHLYVTDLSSQFDDGTVVTTLAADGQPVFEPPPWKRHERVASDVAAAQLVQRHVAQTREVPSTITPVSPDFDAVVTLMNEQQARSARWRRTRGDVVTPEVARKLGENAHIAKMGEAIARELEAINAETKPRDE